MKLNKLLMSVLLCVTMMLTACGNNHEHKFQEILRHDETNHWVECECGEKKDVTTHSWDEGRVTKEETLADDGELTKTCICGATKVEKIDSLAKGAIEMTQPDKSFLAPDMPDETFNEIIEVLRTKASTPMTIELNKDYYFKFDKVASSNAENNAFSIYITALNEKEGYFIDLDKVAESYTLVFELYSLNDLTKPAQVFESFSNLCYDKTAIDNGTYYLHFNIKSHVLSVEEDGKQVIHNVFIMTEYSLT